jgi:hypothetical protein
MNTRIQALRLAALEPLSRSGPRRARSLWPRPVSASRAPLADPRSTFMVRLVSAAVVATLALAGSLAAAQPVPPVRLSVSTSGTEANGASQTYAVSTDGRTVLFHSTATNLVARDTNAQLDFFIRDRDTDRDGIFDEPGAVATIRVNEGLLGEQTTDFLQLVQLSPDGRFVLFHTAAALTPGDTNGVPDVYLRDRDTDADGIFDEAGAVSVERVSTGTGGAQASGYTGSMTRDGRYVIFTSSAQTLHDRPVAGVAQYYRKDRVTGVTSIISSTPDGTPAPFTVYSAAISDDGRYAAFSGGFENTVVMPAGARWILRDLLLNTFVPITAPTPCRPTFP